MLQRIVQDPDIMAGRPVIKGARIPVERIIEHLAREPDLQDLFAAYPELTVDDVKAALRYARIAVTNQTVHAQRTGSPQDGPSPP